MEITIRKAKRLDLDSITRVHVETWKIAYKGVVPDNYIKAFVTRTQNKNWKKQMLDLIKENLFYVAENNKGEIVGFAIGGLERTNHPIYEGELMGIYILKEYQRQGIGKALTRKIVEELIKMKVNNMLVWVLENNPYRAFYDNLIGNIVDKKEHETFKLPVIAYGYNDLPELMKRLVNITI